MSLWKMTRDWKEKRTGVERCDVKGGGDERGFVG